MKSIAHTRSLVRCVGGRLRTVLVCALVAAALAAISFRSARLPGATAHAALFNTITVTTTADENGTNPAACSLREAITAANTNAAFGGCPAGTAGLDTIQFNLGAGTPTINVIGSPLPQITEPVSINGNSGGATRVELNGAALSATSRGLQVYLGADGSTLRSLVINRFGVGIALTFANNNIVQDCYLGTDATGMVDLGNTSYGLNIVDSSEKACSAARTVAGQPSHQCGRQCGRACHLVAPA